MRTLPVLSTLACSLLLLTACQTTSSAPNQASSAANAVSQQSSYVNQSFVALADEAWAFSSQRERGSLPDISPSTLAARYARQQDYYQRISAINPQQLSEANQINRDMILYALRNMISNYEFGMYLRPLTNETGPHNRVANQLSSFRIQRAEDVATYLALVQQVPAWLAQQTAYMREGLATGMAQPQVVLANFPAGIQAYITTDPTASVFYRPAGDAQGRLASNVFNELDLELQTLIATVVNPALADFHDFLINEYIPNAPSTIAATALPNGEAFYADRVKHYTTLDMSPEEIHNIGLAEVARIRAEMEAVIEEVGFTGTFAEFIHFLRTDPQFYVDTPEALLKEAAYIAKRADGVLPQLFHHLPRTPYTVVPVPAEIAPNYTQGRYSRPSRDDQPGEYWVNTYALETRPLYELEALTLHEGVPGHHLQISLAAEMENMPGYRRATYISAFGEGWGLYAEYLGLETGFYQDPYSNFGRLTYEMWRAARLVVDTGMHAKGWSREQAVEFLGSNTALSLHNVNTEIDRYISWPGQALSYKLGDLTIKRLRSEAETALGEDFDVREFHYQILRNGSVPLATLEAQLNAWLAAEVAKRS